MDDVSEKIVMASRLESRIGDLYLEFSRRFTEDRDFWWQLSLEEKNHASILESGRASFVPINAFPEKLIPPDLSELSEMEHQLDAIFEELSNYSRETAFEKALELEKWTVEFYYQQAMDEKQPDPYLSNFQLLNRESGNHIKRIHTYLSSNNVQP